MGITPLIFGETERARLAVLAQEAAKAPVDMAQRSKAANSVSGKRKHMDQMSRQTIHIPMAVVVTYSVEIQKQGLFHHMSMSVEREGRVPHPAGLWMVCEALGFKGSLKDCIVYEEKLMGKAGIAINVMQPIGELAAEVPE